MAQERTARLSASPPLFKSRFLDFFSRIHPAVPALIYGPAIVALVVLGAREGLGGLEIVLLVLAGLLLWTLSEYWLHRKVFHWDRIIRSAIASTSSSTACTTITPTIACAW